MDLIERGNAGAFRHPWETARFKFVSRLIARYCNRADPLVLDVGSGDGFFLETLHKTMDSGEFIGLDIALSDEEVRQLNAASSERVQYYNHWKLMEDLIHRPADLVLLLDVIEHVAEDRTLLGDILNAPFVSNETVTVITAPAFWSLRTSHDDHLRHFRRYSLSQLRQTASEAGFEVIDGGYFFFSLLLPRVAAKLREVVFSPKQQFGIGSWRRGRVVTRTIEAALLADAAIGQTLSRAGIRLPGLSVYLICRRSS